MARRRSSDEDVLNLLCQIELGLTSGSSVATAYRSAGVSNATYYNWRKKCGGMDKSQLQERMLDGDPLARKEWELHQKA